MHNSLGHGKNVSRNLSMTTSHVFRMSAKNDEWRNKKNIEWEETDLRARYQWTRQEFHTRVHKSTNMAACLSNNNNLLFSQDNDSRNDDVYRVTEACVLKELCNLLYNTEQYMYVYVPMYMYNWTYYMVKNRRSCRGHGIAVILCALNIA